MRQAAGRKAPVTRWVPSGPQAAVLVHSLREGLLPPRIAAVAARPLRPQDPQRRRFTPEHGKGGVDRTLGDQELSHDEHAAQRVGSAVSPRGVRERRPAGPRLPRSARHAGRRGAEAGSRIGCGAASRTARDARAVVPHRVNRSMGSRSGRDNRRRSTGARCRSASGVSAPARLRACGRWRPRIPRDRVDRRRQRARGAGAPYVGQGGGGCTRARRCRERARLPW